MDAVMFLLGAFALVAGISKMVGAKTSWYRPARDTSWELRDRGWLRKLSGAFLILYAVISFVAIGAGWFR